MNLGCDVRDIGFDIVLNCSGFEMLGSKHRYMGSGSLEFV